MRIAVNTRALFSEQPEQYVFIREIFTRLAIQYPQHQFLFFFDNPIHEKDYPPNIVPVVVPGRTYSALSTQWWYSVKLPLALKKYKADVYVSADGICSLLTSIPQVLIVPDLAFLYYPKLVSGKPLPFYKRYTPKFLKKAREILVWSNFVKQDIVTQFKLPAESVNLLPASPRPGFQPVGWEQKEQIKEQYAEGCEYFVFAGGTLPVNNLPNLLKAYSLFKLRQHTNMKLLVLGGLAADGNNILDKIKTYKFREGVKVLGLLPEAEMARVIAGAYALVLPGYYQGYGGFALEAMQSKVPVIASGNGCIPELAGDAALFVNPADPADIAEKMKIIFKDEGLRGRLIHQGKALAAAFSWPQTAGLMWQSIERAVSG